MSPGEFVEVVRNISYRPGWTLSASWRRERNAVQVILDAEVDDAYSQDGATISVAMVQWLTTESIVVFDVSMVLDWVRRYLFMEMEDHESREFFKYNGERVFDPHKGEQR